MSLIVFFSFLSNAIHECLLLVLGIILSLEGHDFALNNITLAADVWSD